MLRFAIGRTPVSQYLSLQCPQFTAESSETSAGYLGAAVGSLGDDFQQLLDTPATNGGNNPELGEIGADRVDDGSLLTDVEMARIKQLCCSTVLVGTNRTFGLATALQIASVSVVSFFCRLT